MAIFSVFYKLSSCGLLQHYSSYYLFPLLSCLLSIRQVLHVRYYYTCIMIHICIQNMTHILWYILYKWVYTLLITLLINIIIILYQLIFNNFWIYIIHYINLWLIEFLLGIGWFLLFLGVVAIVGCILQKLVELRSSSLIEVSVCYKLS